MAFNRTSDNDISKQREKAEIAECKKCAAQAREISALRRNIAELEQQVFHDPLTNLYNRRFFLEMLEKKLMHIDRYAESGALLFLDVDNLKQINDLYGHVEGDHVLQIFGQAILDNIRKADIAARIGGDEFAILMEPLAVHQMADKAAALSDILSRTCRTAFPGMSTLGISIGYSAVTKGMSAQQLIAQADRIMYQQKKKKY